MTKNIIMTAMALVLSLAATGASASVINITAGIGADAVTLEQSWLGSITPAGSASFEEYAPNTVATASGINLAIGTLYGYGHVGGPGTTMGAHGEHATDGVNYWSNAAPGSTSLKGDFTLALNAGLYSVGFYSTDFHDTGGKVNITVNTASASQTFDLFSHTGALANGKEVYWLIKSDQAIQSIVFHRAGNDGYAIDGITAATPIPGAAWLLGSGLLCLLGLRRLRATS